MPTYPNNLNHNAVSEARELNLRTEEVQELLGQMPNWMIRWGITVVFAIVGLLLLASWLVQYPDVLTSRVVITTQTPPVSLVARAGGRLQLLVKDAAMVAPNTYLAVIQNPAAFPDVQYLLQQLKPLQNQVSQAPAKTIAATTLPENLRLGELQDAYLALLTGYQEYQRHHDTHLRAQQIRALQQRLQSYHQLNEQLEKQGLILAEELALAQKRYATDQALFAQNVIAEAELDGSKNSFLQTKRTFESAQGQLINNQILITQLQAQITEHQTTGTEQESRLRATIQNALHQLAGRLAAWEQQYVLKAPLAGEVVLVKSRSQNQFINAGEAVFTIVPPSGALYAQVQMPIAGSGKVALGQRVNIKFDNYPAHEFGTVSGIVAAIAPVPQNNLYTVQIALPRNLTTSYRRELPFRQEMQGTAEIITQDLRLIERIFHQFRALLDHPRS